MINSPKAEPIICEEYTCQGRVFLPSKLLEVLKKARNSAPNTPRDESNAAPLPQTPRKRMRGRLSRSA